MRVKKLSLKNFKSFPSANVQFDGGFAAIVGPNGSGKSNLIDSLLFAFGESSLKNMRVKKTSDLVFKNHNFAEVTVVLEGSEAGSGSEKRVEHEIKRLVRKDGKTKYAFDGKRVKKYVIEEFLAQNRISLQNMIKQGDVQRIVEMNAKDRRAYIDFVANVAEYEEKKKEALTELESVEQKLREARSLLAEREGYLQELKQDRENALKFMELDARVKRLKATLLHVDLTALEKEFENVVNALLDGNSKSNELQKQITAFEEKIALKQREIDEINKEIVERSQGKEIELQKEIDALNAAISLNLKLVEERKATIAKSEARERELALEKQRAADEVKGAVSRLKELEQELSAVNKLLSEESAKLNALLKESDRFSSGFQEARMVFEQANAEMLSVKEQLAALQAEVSKQEEIKRLRENELQRLRTGEGISDFSEKKSVLEKRLSEEVKLVKELEEKINALFEEEKKANQRIAVLEDLILVSREKIAEKEALLRSAGEGSGKALEVVLQLQEKMRGIHGTLQQLCSYSPKNALPVSVALGNRLNYVVVDDVETAGKAIEELKKTRAGRVSFIPLDKIQAPPKPDKALLREKGAVAFVKDLLEYDARFEKAFAFACSNTVLFDDLKNAEKLVGEARMVTREGELIEQSGLVTGGFTQAKVNPFAEARELSEWREKLEVSKREKDAIVEHLTRVRQEASDLRRKKSEAEIKARTTQLELEHLTVEEEKVFKQRANLSTAVKELEKQIKECDSAISQGNEKRSELVRKLSDLNIRALEAKQKIDLEKEQRLGFAVRELEKKVSDYKVSCSTLENQIKSLEAQKSVFERQLQSVLKQESEFKEEVEAARKELNRADSEIKAARTALEEKTREQKKLSSALKDLIERREEAQKESMRLANEKGKLQFALDKVAREGNELEVRKAVLESKLGDLKAQYAVFEGVELIQGKTVDDKPELLVELKKLEEQVQALGPINLRAVEQFDQRAKELVEQKERVEQLSNEKQAVIAIINEIEGKKISTFMQAFNAVNENFKRLFKQIFSGQGELALENPENPFEGGLSMRVQLGTEVKYLELLSGGEKSLVALLFLFALQSVNPSSIYVLDEADAALDAENSRKLSELLKKLSRNTQFLVVSHNENVYKNADCLIGVAMSKEGSKLVEVKLGEAAFVDNEIQVA